jgi:hypothetical protein
MRIESDFSGGKTWNWPPLLAVVVSFAWLAHAPQAIAQSGGGDLKKFAGVWYVVAEEFHGEQTASENLIGAKHTLTVTGNEFVFETGLPDGTRRRKKGSGFHIR